jgi:hypothetical protein
MNMREFLNRLAPRPQARPRVTRTTDWTTSFTPRDWADLPVYHPRRESDAL